MKNIIESIQKSTKYVSDNSRFVKIDYNAIKDFVDQIQSNDISNKHWLCSSPFSILDLKICDIVNFLLMYHSIGYSYWGNPKWTVKVNEDMYDGAFAMIHCILNLMKDNKFNYIKISKLSFDEFSSYLNGTIEIPLLERRYFDFTSTAGIVAKYMNGNFYEYIKDIQKDKVLLDIIVNNFPSYEDTLTYKGKDIYFFKRAQLLVSDILHIINYKENISVDCSSLVGCADYKIPQVMRKLGILVYNDELSALVNNKIEIQKGSEYEVEIRANMLTALDDICNSLNNRLLKIDINDIIWLQGQIKGKNTLPYHLTRTTAY